MDSSVDQIPTKYLLSSVFWMGLVPIKYLLSSVFWMGLYKENNSSHNSPSERITFAQLLLY